MAKPSERNQQVIRQWEVLRRLEAGPSTVDELAAGVGDHGTTRRTIYRDLDALQAARFPIVRERHEDNRVRWRLLTKGLRPRRTA